MAANITSREALQLVGHVERSNKREGEGTKGSRWIRHRRGCGISISITVMVVVAEVVVVKAICIAIIR